MWRVWKRGDMAAIERLRSALQAILECEAKGLLSRMPCETFVQMQSVSRIGSAVVATVSARARVHERAGADSLDRRSALF
jgi:hypothetical protein